MDLYNKEIITALSAENNFSLKKTQIEKIFTENRDAWKLPRNTSRTEFIEHLITKKVLATISFGPKSRTETRYIFKNRDIKTDILALNLYSNSYLSHYSAVAFHDLTDEIVKSIYVTHEQTPKKTDDKIKDIQQDDITTAFSKPMRFTKNSLDYNNQTIYFLNGQYTDKLGVIQRQDLYVTDLERTLIDITVRPQYSGGIYEVLEVYKKAREQVSVNRIAAYLRKMNFKFPYHQSIGFLLEKANYKEKVLSTFENKFPITSDFYMTYDMKDKNFSEKWRLYYPKHL